jgi:hypothetical protein
MPSNFDWHPLYSYNTLFIKEITDSDYQDCPCYGSMCCDGAGTLCYENVSNESCDCLIGPGLTNPSVSEIFDDPCNPIFFRHPNYTHFNRFINNLGIYDKSGRCTSMPATTPSEGDYNYISSTNPAIFFSYPSCGEIKKICQGEDESGEGL